MMFVLSFLSEAVAALLGGFIAFLTLPVFGYLRLLTIFGWGPEVIYYETHQREIKKYLKPILATAAVGLILGIPWDLLALRDHVWYFTNYLNIWILGIPLEEYLFFFFYPLGVAAVIITLKVHGRVNVRPS
jgi:lycopene cyclase domain-containing protein